MDVVLPLVFATAVIVLLGLAYRRARRQKQDRARQKLIDAEFELIVKNEWKRPDA